MGNFRYPGAQPFKQDQQKLFFGRADDIKNLLRMIRLHELVVLHSKSGLGKSSLLNAGVIPELLVKGKNEPLMIRFGAWTEDSKITPVQQTMEVIQQGIKEDCFLDKFKADRNTFWYATKKRQLLDQSKKIILFFDQFEELFTYPLQQINDFRKKLAEMIVVQIPAEIREQLLPDWEAKGFTDEEVDLLFESPDLSVLFAIRSDRFHLMDRFKTVLPSILKNVYELLPLKREDARLAIISPALVSGAYASNPFEYTDPAIEKILNFLEDKNGFIESIQLQILCQSFEDKVKEEKLEQIGLEEVKDLKNIISNYYFDKINAIEDLEEREKAKRFIEDGLVLEDGQIRLSLHEGQIKKLFDVGPVLLKKLVDSHLLRSEPAKQGMSGYVYELSHDTLVPPVLASKKERIAREKLETLRQERLELEKKLEEKRKKRQRLFLLIISMLTTLLAAMAFLAFFQANRAKNATEESRQEIEAKNTELEDANDKLTAQSKSLEDQRDSIERQKNELQAQYARLNALNTELENQKAIIDRKNDSLIEKGFELDSINKILEGQKDKLVEYNKLLEIEKDLEKIKSKSLEDSLEVQRELNDLKVSVEEYQKEVLNAQISWILSEAINKNLSGKKDDKMLAKALMFIAYNINEANESDRKNTFRKDIYQKASLIAEDITDLESLNSKSDIQAIITIPDNPDLMMSTGYNGQVLVWDKSNGAWKIQRRLLQRNAVTTPIYNMTLTPDSDWILGGNEKGELIIWNSEKGVAPKLDKKIHDASINKITFSDPTHFFTAGLDGQIFRHTLQVNGDNIRINSDLWRKYDAPVVELLKKESTNELIVGLFNKIEVISSEIPGETTIEQTLANPLTAMDSYGNHLIYGTQNGLLIQGMMEPSSGQIQFEELNSGENEKSQVTTILFDKDKTQVAVGRANGSMALIQMVEVEERLNLDFEQMNIQNLRSLIRTAAYSANDESLIVGTGTEQFKIYIFSKNILPIVQKICDSYRKDDRGNKRSTEEATALLDQTMEAFNKSFGAYISKEDKEDIRAILLECIQ